MDAVTIIREMTAALDDAIGLADDAVKSAEAAQKATPKESGITLVKVAAARCEELAGVLMKTGAFREYTRRDLAKAIETAGPQGLVEMMEKLASRAVFPLDAEEALFGDLVEKSADSWTPGIEPNSPTAVWRKALDEAEVECAR